MKLNSRGVKVRAFMVGLAALAYLYEVWWKSDEARDAQPGRQPLNAASNPPPAASALPPEGGNAAAQRGH